MQGAQGVTAYRTIRQNSETELVINKSRFIGRCFPVTEEKEAADILETLRKRYWDASHHCYAFRIGQGGALSRSSDDGEPSGTAGAPIRNVLTRMELVNVLCVVTRYFGGILLGAGGLIRAYTNAAAEAAKLAGGVWMRPCTCVSVLLQYPQYAALEKQLKACGEIENIAYTDAVTVKLWIPDAAVASVTERLLNASDGRAVIGICGNDMRPADCENLCLAGEDER